MNYLTTLVVALNAIARNPKHVAKFHVYFCTMVEQHSDLLSSWRSYSKAGMSAADRKGLLEDEKRQEELVKFWESLQRWANAVQGDAGCECLAETIAGCMREWAAVKVYDDGGNGLQTRDVANLVSYLEEVARYK